MSQRAKRPEDLKREREEDAEELRRRYGNWRLLVGWLSQVKCTPPLVGRFLARSYVFYVLVARDRFSRCVCSRGVQHQCGVGRYVPSSVPIVVYGRSSGMAGRYEGYGKVRGPMYQL